MTLLRSLFALTIFLSAFLLLVVEPMAAKQLLPTLGGSAAVWTTCLVFFSLMLLLGYLYAHWISSQFTPTRQAVMHILLLTAALLTPRPPELMVLNEPETSLHPDLLPALARLIAAAAARTQILVVSHAQTLVGALEESGRCGRLQLEKSFGETVLAGTTVLNQLRWEWPAR